MPCNFFCVAFLNEIVLVIRELFQRSVIICGCRVLSRCSGHQFCGGLSTFCSLQELLSGFVSTNMTQILQARKQMEYGDNKY